MREAASFIASQKASDPAGLLAAATRMAETALRSWAKRRNLVKLSDLDDHQLADIGITREDLRWALNLPFSHDPGLALQDRALRNRGPGWRD